MAILALRAASAISFSEPLLAITSGAEEESTFALWKVAKGLPVYADPYTPPFAASHYNWLFFAIYGTTAAVVQHLANLGDAWLPTIGRFPSLVFSLIGTILGYVAWRPALASLGTQGHVLGASLAGFVFFGPLMGFWAISINPELPATVLGLAAVVVCLSYYRQKPVAAVLAASLLSYMAWSCKQSHVFVAVALGLFLILRGDWRHLAILLGVHLLLVAATLALGSETYRLMIVYYLPLLGKMLGIAPSGFVTDSATLVRNLSNLAAKAGPLLAFAAALPWLLCRRGDAWRQAIADDRVSLALCGVLVSAALAIPASAKVGAAENYYFPLTMFLAYFLVALWPHLSLRPQTARIAFAILGVGWMVNAAACAAVLGGKAGVLSVRPWHEKLSAQRDCIVGTPGPRFLAQTHLAVPWINPTGPYFVYSYNYVRDRHAGYAFPQGGIGDMIATGYFATLIMAEGSPAEFDGAGFGRYTLTPSTCAGLSIYRRAE
jgi:hypothetical protein